MKPRILPLIAASVAVLLLAAAVVRAETSKLNPRARIALAELRAGGSPRDLQLQSLPVDSATGALDVFIRGSVSRAELEAAGAIVRTEIPGIGVFTAFVPEAALEAVEALPGVERISGAVKYEENLNASLPTTMADIQRTAGPAFTGANGAGILIGDIDSGISYAHGDFDDAAGNTRIHRIWDQTVSTGTPPAGYSYGSEYLPPAIDGNTAQGKDTNGHGTHVMGIAAGDGSLTGGSIPAHTYAGVAPMAAIVEVKSTYTDTQILDGAAYFFGLATAAGMNAVLNISLGSQFGPHDGSEALSVGLDALTGPGRAICVSAGNDGGTTTPLSHRHARVDYGPTYPNTVNAVLTLSGTGVGRIVGVDGYYDYLDAVNVTVSHPSYGSFGPYTLGTINGTYPGVQFGTGTTKGYLYVENGAYYSASGDPEVYAEIRAGSTTGSTFNGNWTFTFTPTAPAGPQNGRIDLWRFYSSTGAVANFSAGIDDNCLLGGDIATANNVITCGAWITKTSWTNCYGYNISYSATTPPTTVNLIASFSSNGPTRDGRLKPDIAAPGQGIGAALTRDISLGTCSTSSSYYSFLNDNMTHWINQGTSMAAPHTAGAVALLFQKFGALTRAQIMARLSALALVDGNTGAVPNNLWGAGKLRVDVTDPTVLVGYPNGGEVFDIATPYNLTWSATDPVWSGVVNVDLQLSRDNGGSWENIALGVANSGSYSWPATGPATTLALVRVRAHDVADNVGQDQSNAVFTIANPPVPVEMSLFLAEATDAGIRISWSFVDPAQYVAACAERAAGSRGPWSPVDGPVTIAGGVSSVIDGAAEPGTTCFYRVRATDRQGATSAFGPISLVAGRTISSFVLGPVWPNPATGLARVDFSVPHPARVTLRVFDIQGRAVATLAERDYGPGRYQVGWDGRTDDGSSAASGIYFVHLLAPGNRLVQRVVLSR